MSALAVITGSERFRGKPVISLVLDGRAAARAGMFDDWYLRSGSAGGTRRRPTRFPGPAVPNVSPAQTGLFSLVSGAR
jgi:hypothetical protein